ncbi:MAG: Coenzyme F420 hydrogenase/dehydrogenase, beta subunit C-terminal domain, partial [Thermodesulfobacteriota bacterium]|nr:Coenzyme F420 hydrogenase/dehydrogenase, beta subunit C-terminal domain [Thermodesulfobacteriota bacterium]
GEYPGNFVVNGKDGSKGVVDKFTFNYLSFFYTPFRCLSCIDLTNELADLSLGDGWRGLNRESGYGQSVVIVRNKKLAGCLNNGAENGKFHLREICTEEAIMMHSNVLDNKKIGAFVRMNILKRFGYYVPEYFLTAPVYTRKRYLFEFINLIILLIGQTRIARKLINTIPLLILKKAMNYIRGKWREKTKKKFIT